MSCIEIVCLSEILLKYWLIKLIHLVKYINSVNLKEDNYLGLPSGFSRICCVHVSNGVVPAIARGTIIKQEGENLTKAIHLCIFHSFKPILSKL